MVKDLPLQITPELTLMLGVVLTVTELTAVFDPTQPEALVPLTE